MAESMKILWPVDPFAEDYLKQRSAAYAVKSLIRNRGAVIVPIYVWGAFVTDIPVDLPHDFLPKIYDAAQASLDKILEPTDLRCVAPIRIIARHKFSIRDAVDRIVRIAEHWKADLIVASSHARRGLSRIFMGSFSETLALKSDVPLFIVNPKWKRSSEQFKNIVFPTDFSEESAQAFNQVLDFAKSIEARVIVFNKLQMMFPPAYGPAFTAYPAFESFFEKDLEARREILAAWVKRAKDFGVSAESVIDPNMGSSTVEAILKAERRFPGLIAMASHSGPVKATLLGSVTRDLLRRSATPVWVVHPESRRAALRKAA